MTAPVTAVTADTPLDEALSTMIRNHFGYLPVVDVEHRIIGILSRRDLLMRRIGEKEAALQTLEAFASAGGPG
jgi:CBS-domain-containing membrane protein